MLQPTRRSWSASMGRFGAFACRSTSRASSTICASTSISCASGCPCSHPCRWPQSRGAARWGSRGQSSTSSIPAVWGMAKPEFDPREVLEKYVAVLQQPSGALVRDVSDLAHPKEAIRIVLQHCIRTAADQEAREFLRNAYASLSNFQQINDAEREALEVLTE